MVRCLGGLGPDGGRNWGYIENNSQANGVWPPIAIPSTTRGHITRRYRHVGSRPLKSHLHSFRRHSAIGEVVEIRRVS